MGRALQPCTVPGCPTLTPIGRCTEHQREADRLRGGARARGYDRGHQRFRRAVLRRDRRCVLCGEPATVADHHPTSRRELVRLGLNPDDPARGRGLCASCHGTETATHQPGGFNDRRDGK